MREQFVLYFGDQGVELRVEVRMKDDFPSHAINMMPNTYAVKGMQADGRKKPLMGTTRNCWSPKPRICGAVHRRITVGGPLHRRPRCLQSLASAQGFVTDDTGVGSGPRATLPHGRAAVARWRKRMTRLSGVLFVVCGLVLGLASAAGAQAARVSAAAERDRAASTEADERVAPREPDGWRQLGGPHRNFRVDAGAVATAWGEGGPTQLWSRTLGEGYSSILADGDRLVTMYRRDDTEVIIALDAATGATRWEYAYPAPLVHNGYFDVWLNSAGPGPYSTPLIAGDTVFAVGVDGRFHALDARTGALRWAQDLAAAFEVAEYNAFASSPIAYGRTVILPLGGSGHGVVAFDRETGATVWRSPAFDLAPGSPVLIEVDGQDQLVVVGQQELVGLDPRDGRRLWSHPHANDLGLNLSMPVRVADDTLFLSSGYDGGSRLIRLSRTGGRMATEEVWFNNRMRVHFGNALPIDGLVVASTGDFGPAFVAALDVATGAEVWRERAFARAQMLDAGGLLVLLDEDGELAVASVTLDGMQVHARAPVLTANAWTPPTLVGSTLYVRDRHRIVALALDDRSAAATGPR